MTDNKNITKLFHNKEISIYLDNNQTIKLMAQPIWRFLEDEKWLRFYSILSWTVEDWKKIIPVQLSSTFDYFVLVICDLGQYKELGQIVDWLCYGLELLFPDFDFDKVNFNQKQLLIGDVILTEEIWDYLNYVVKWFSGEKVTQPLTNLSPEAKAFYEAQRKNEEKIKKLKAQNAGSNGELIKVFLAITYSFPSLTFDYLFEQTMAQIHWLQELAAGEVSYQINARAFAAGNVKKGKKLDFFIK